MALEAFGVGSLFLLFQGGRLRRFLTQASGAMKMLGMSDDELPTWLHTALTFLIVLPFALLPIVPGVGALRSGVLAPMMGPDFGFFLFGDQTLHDHLARQAGWSLVALGLSFLGIGVGFCRWAQGDSRIRIGLCALWVSSTVLYGVAYRSAIP